MSGDVVLLEMLDGGIAEVRLNRPDALNALNEELARGFLRRMDEIASAGNVRAVIVTGMGKAFCAGGDLVAFKASTQAGALLHGLAKTFHEGVKKIRQADAPFIAAINGPCFGVGLSLACACDFRVASEHATFAVAFTGVGLSPDSGLPYYLPRIVGHAKATELALLNPVIDANQALGMHLLHRVGKNSVDEARALALQIARMPPRAIAATKRLLDEAFSDPLGVHLDKELASVRDTGDTADFREGCAAFLEKRRPTFTGR